MKRMKILAAKLTAGIISLCMVLILPMCTSMPAVSSAYAENAGISNVSEFSDMNKDHWAFQSVNRLAQRGILSGYPDGSFQPGRTVTYGEYIKMAVTADYDDSIYFVNCGPANNAPGELSNNNVHWAEEYYEMALSKNYFSKNRITKNMLPYPIPRRDMALISSSVIGKIMIENYSEIQAGIKDIDFRSPDEYEITKAYATGVLKGYPDGTFKPDRTLTRAEAAASIERLIAAKTSKSMIVEDAENEKRTVPRPPEGTELKAIDDLISNRNEIPIMKDVKYYWTTDATPYEFEKIRSLLGTEALKILPADPARVVIFVMGDKAYRTNDMGSYVYWVTGTGDGSDLPDFDQMGLYRRNSDTMMLIKNPYK